MEGKALPENLPEKLRPETVDVDMMEPMQDQL
jgi:hypothetical protein